MTTARKLWLGFGTLTALLVLSTVAIIFRVRNIEHEVDELAGAARARSAAARQLEVNVLGYALSVRAHLQSDDAKPRRDAAEEAAEVERYLREYDGYATTDAQRAMAARLVSMWGNLKELGEELLDAEDRRPAPEKSRQFYEARSALEDLLDDEVQRDAVDIYAARRDAVLRDLKRILTFALMLLAVGAAIAVVTSSTVGAAVVKGERQLSASRERLRVTLASIGDAVITTDREGGVTYLNAVAESLTGWTTSAAKGQPLDQVFHIVNESTRERAANPAARALQEGAIVGLANHTVLIGRDGTERTIDDSAAPIKGDRGEIVGCVLIFRDVGEQRRATQALEFSEARLTAIFETALDCIVSIDCHGAITEFNAAAEQTFGHRREDVLGRELAAVLIPPAFRELHRQGLAKYLVTGEGPILNQRLELSALRADGSEFPVELTVTRIPVDGPPQFTAYLRDITERKLARTALRESEERFRTLADNMSQFAWTADAKGWIYWYNQRWYDYTGTTLEQMQGWGWKAVHHPDHVDRVVVRIQRSWDTGEPWEDTFPLRGKDGEYRWFLSRALPIRNAQGDVVRWFGTNTDVTEQRLMAEELRKYAADLSEADRRKNEFLAMLAHELRNPLAPIRNALQIMRLTGGNGEEVGTVSEMMERQVGQMVRLVDDLLDVSRITRGKIELRTARIELASAVNHALEAARATAACQDHELIVTLPIEPIYLDADPIRIAQVVGNLLNNACKFTEKGGRIWLTVEVADGNLASRERKRPEAVLRVRDTGIGIAPEQLPRIFDMFMQVDTSIERSVSGLGIGLTMVKNLVEMHGGTVEIHSDGIGQGSEFIVRLPIAENAAVPFPEPTVAQPTPATARRILVVDDNRDSVSSLAMLMKLSGHQTHTAFDGVQAVAAAAEFHPEVVLLDIGLPELNGYEVARKIRAQPWGQDMVLVALTGWGQDEDRRKSKEAGFNGHLVKPVDHTALMTMLADLLPA